MKLLYSIYLYGFYMAKIINVFKLFKHNKHGILTLYYRKKLLYAIRQSIKLSYTFYTNYIVLYKFQIFTGMLK